MGLLVVERGVASKGTSDGTLNVNTRRGTAVTWCSNDTRYQVQNISIYKPPSTL
jgi:hypothetical protein